MDSHRWTVTVRSLLGIGAIALSSVPSNAEVIPDDSLGNESSRVRSRQVQGRLTERIEGGAIREENLFHSFREFNVRNGDRVYFANPVGIENIFGRITGFDASHIHGTLGVDGDANLFLMNPNGVVFGRNAQLDISGSLTVTTADRITFGNNQFFSAFNPEPPSPLLTISVPLGLQYEMGRGLAAPIQSQATLVTGDDLTLDAGFLDLSGRIRAGGDLTLQAHSILQIENALNQQFVATSGGDLVLQGDGAINIINTLSTVPPRFQSGEDLWLLSDGVITTNAQFRSTGDFGIQTLDDEPGTWINQQNAVVNVDGNYTIGDYTGPSLQVNAGGDIRFGRVVIDALDPAVNPEHPVFALNAGGDITGRGEVSAAEELPGLIVSLVSQGDIDTQRIHTRGGLISLVSPEGNINTRGDLNTGSILSGRRGPIIDEGDGVPEEYVAGAIVLFAGETIDLSGNNLNARTASERDDAEDGGTVSLYAGQDINASRSDLLTSSDGYFFVLNDRQTGDSSDAGPISIYAGRNIDLSNADLRAESQENSGDTGDGGSISVYAHDNLNALNSDSWSGSGFTFGRETGDGGIISFYAGNDFDISYSDIVSSADTFLGGTSGNGGNVIVYSGRDITAFNWELFAGSATSSGVSGDGGIISVHAERDAYISDAAFSSSSDTFSGEGSRDGGNIYFYTGGNLYVSNTSFSSETFAWRDHTFVGDGGDIFLHVGGDLTVSDLDITSISYSRLDSGKGGDISLYIVGDIDGDISLLSLTYSRLGNSGDGGNISVIVPNGHIDGLEGDIALYSASVGETEPNSDERQIGRGGDIYLEVGEAISNLEVLTASSFGQSGDVRVEGLSNLSLRNINILTSQQLQIEADPFGNEPLSVFVGENTQPGDVVIRSPGRLSLIDSYIESNSRSQNPAGDILLNSPIQITLRNTNILSNTISTGDAGNINLFTEQLSLQNTNVRAESRPESLRESDTPGTGGDINTTANIINLDASTISVSAQENAQAGSLDITTNTLTLQNRSSISAEADTVNQQTGNITIHVDDLTLSDQSEISTRSQNAPAGDIRITVDNSFSATNSTLTTSAEQNSGGNIRLTASDIRLYGDSDITTDSGIDGGNITLRANSIIAFDDSDILAFAQQQGGNIRLNTPIFFGNGFSVASLSADPEAVELNGNGRVDINATGAISGIVALPDLSFLQNNLVDLSESPLNTDALLAGSCVTRTANSSIFLITGSGGLPDRPGDAPPSSYPTGTIRTIPENDGFDVSTEANRWELGDQIAEPQGLYQLSDGRIILSQECTFE